jgi:hypothetical protein
MKFKLKDQSEIVVSDAVQFHARALRAIGQDLSNLFPQSLEITLTGTNFQVDGRYLPRPAGDKGGKREGALLDKLRNKLRADSAVCGPAESATSPISFSRTYCPADIETIDEAGMARRNDATTAPDIYSLGEMLRMVGRIVDSNGRRLQKLSKDTYGVRFEYEDSAGEIKKVELSSLQLYKLQQKYHAERGTHVAIDTWKGSI